MYNSIIADRSTWYKEQKTIGNQKMVLVAIQKSRRILQKGKTKYVYLKSETSEIYYNQSKDGVFYLPIAYTTKDMEKYHHVFTNSCTTKEEKWLKRNNYEII